MTETGPIESAKWIRAALQVNPYSYHGRNSPSTKFSDEQSYNAALIQTLQDLSISMIAITDHWCVDSALGLARDAEAAGIAVLPGFEANSSEGIHLLVLFERNTPPSTINAAIGQCGVAPSCPNGTTGRPYAEIMQSMTEAGALVIPAHANVANSGMLTGRSGNPLVKMIQHPCLHAIGITPDVADGIDQEAIFAGTTPTPALTNSQKFTQTTFVTQIHSRQQERAAGSSSAPANWPASNSQSVRREPASASWTHPRHPVLSSEKFPGRAASWTAYLWICQTS